jgi:hypothetical protein
VNVPTAYGRSTPERTRAVPLVAREPATPLIDGDEDGLAEWRRRLVRVCPRCGQRTVGDAGRCSACGTCKEPVLPRDWVASLVAAGEFGSIHALGAPFAATPSMPTCPARLAAQGLPTPRATAARASWRDVVRPLGAYAGGRP